MSLGKLPVFKNLVPSSHSKRRLKPELTTDMISSPLGDFRHTMHVGRGGDVFGDTSFLSDHGGEKAREGAKSNLLVRALRNVRKSPMRNSSREVAPPPVVSPIIKNAVSLPHLLETKNGSVERLNFKTVVSSPGVMDGSYGLESGFCTLPRWSRLEKSKDTSAKVDLAKPSEDLDLDLVDLELPRTDSFLSFSLDLGPSLMSEVLAVMGSESQPRGHLETEVPCAPDNGARPVKFHLEGSLDQRNGAALRNGHEEWRGEVTLPGVVRDFSRETSQSGLRRRYQQPTGLDQDATERHRGSLNAPGFKRASAGEYRHVSQPPGATIRAQDGGGPPAGNGSLVPRLLSRHFAATASQELRQRGGSLPSNEGDTGTQRSWRSSKQRVPADGEEAELGHRERHWENRLPLGEGTGFNPLKAETFAYADEDEEIRV